MSIEIASIAMQCNVHYGHDCHDIEQNTQNTKQTNKQQQNSKSWRLLCCMYSQAHANALPSDSIHLVRFQLSFLVDFLINCVCYTHKINPCRKFPHASTY